MLPVAVAYVSTRKHVAADFWRPSSGPYQHDYCCYCTLGVCYCTVNTTTDIESARKKILPLAKYNSIYNVSNTTFDNLAMYRTELKDKMHCLKMSCNEKTLFAYVHSTESQMLNRRDCVHFAVSITDFIYYCECMYCEFARHFSLI